MAALFGGKGTSDRKHQDAQQALERQLGALRAQLEIEKHDAAQQLAAAQEEVRHLRRELDARPRVADNDVRRALAHIDVLCGELGEQEYDAHAPVVGQAEAGTMRRPSPETVHASTMTPNLAPPMGAPSMSTMDAGAGGTAPMALLVDVEQQTDTDFGRAQLRTSAVQAVRETQSTHAQVATEQRSEASLTMAIDLSTACTQAGTAEPGVHAHTQSSSMSATALGSDTTPRTWEAPVTTPATVSALAQTVDTGGEPTHADLAAAIGVALLGTELTSLEADAPTTAHGEVGAQVELEDDDLDVASAVEYLASALRSSHQAQVEALEAMRADQSRNHRVHAARLASLVAERASRPSSGAGKRADGLRRQAPTGSDASAGRGGSLSPPDRALTPEPLHAGVLAARPPLPMARLRLEAGAGLAGPDWGSDRCATPEPFSSATSVPTRPPPSSTDRGIQSAEPHTVSEGTQTPAATRSPIAAQPRALSPRSSMRALAMEHAALQREIDRARSSRWPDARAQGPQRGCQANDEELRSSSYTSANGPVWMHQAVKAGSSESAAHQPLAGVSNGHGLRDQSANVSAAVRTPTARAIQGFASTLSAQQERIAFLEAVVRNVTSPASLTPWEAQAMTPPDGRLGL